MSTIQALASSFSTALSAIPIDTLQVRFIQDRVNALFSRDYKTSLIPNQFCPSYPLEIVLPGIIVCIYERIPGFIIAVGRKFGWRSHGKTRWNCQKLERIHGSLQILQMSSTYSRSGTRYVFSMGGVELAETPPATSLLLKSANTRLIETSGPWKNHCEIFGLVGGVGDCLRNQILFPTQVCSPFVTYIYRYISDIDSIYTLYITFRSRDEMEPPFKTKLTLQWP